MPIEKGTISIRLVREALADAVGQGLDACVPLAAAGIPAELFDKPYARVSIQAYSRLWLRLARQLDDEFFAMNRRRMKAGSFNFMARTAIREATLEAALQRALEFLGLLFDGLTPRLLVQDGVAAIQIEEGEGVAQRAFCYFTLFLMVHGLACWLAGQRIPILAIDLRCAQPDYIEDYRVMFSDNLHFARAQTRLLFNAEALALAVRRDERELRRFLAGAPANILVRYRDPQSLAARTKAYLRSIRCERWPDLEALAGHFFMAPSTLRRKLAAEGQSYQGLKDQLRRDLAIARLDRGEGNFAELALELGFADTSAFYKAFRKWTGSTPGRYRQLSDSRQAWPHPSRNPKPGR